ncbi:MAG: hypothetical protein LUO97_00755 [Methanomicrobiales archaeon]|nr:hypothetical protein [Methanomicrobiales archaeon]MDD1668307.1 hypothetical protein [Methanomicrobiales archaeon]
MFFNSIDYFIFFVFVVLCVHAVRERYYQHLILLAASLYFYWTSADTLITILFYVSLVSYYCGGKIHEYDSDDRKRKIFLVISIVSTLSVLAFFKYFNFAVDSVNALFSTLHLPYPPIIVLQVALPVGISFYTFEDLSYIFDIYLRKVAPAENYFDYIMFVAFFPKLVAGPVVTAHEFIPQLKKPLVITAENVKLGVIRIIIGVMKKVVIADNVGYYVDLVFSNPSTPIRQSNSFFIISATILFGLQIYFDFSGYVDIALGSGKILGFWFPENFDNPYLAATPTEFWRKWNITISRFIRNYLYIPMGGNRKGRARTYVNLVFSMVVCGIWHGAAWNFALWGLYHGIVLALHKIVGAVKVAFLEAHRNIHFLAGVIVTQILVFIGWILFRVKDIPDILYCINKVIFIDIHSILNGLSKYSDIISINAVFFVPVIIAVLVISYKKRWWAVDFRSSTEFDYIGYIAGLNYRYLTLFFAAMILAIMCLAPSSSPEFIYFQF